CPPEPYARSLHDALPIWSTWRGGAGTTSPTCCRCWCSARWHWCAWWWAVSATSGRYPASGATGRGRWQPPEGRLSLHPGGPKRPAPPPQQGEGNGQVDGRLDPAAFNRPPEMHAHQHRRRVDQPVEGFPAAAEAAHQGREGGHRQRRQDHQGGERWEERRVGKEWRSLR